jgi:hypothetical protein
MVEAEKGGLFYYMAQDTPWEEAERELSSSSAIFRYRHELQL